MSDCKHMYGLTYYDYEGHEPIEFDETLVMIADVAYAQKCLDERIGEAAERFDYCPRCGARLRESPASLPTDAIP